jgi:APA family basic amino acid/polyamine antiporter
MARDGRFFAPFARLSGRFGTPMPAIVMLGVMSVVLLVIAGAKGVDKLLNGVVFVDGVFFVLTCAAVFVLRKRRRDAERPFRVPLYPIVPAIVVLGQLGVVAGAYVDEGVRGAAYIGVAWMAAGVVLYLVMFRRGARAA